MNIVTVWVLVSVSLMDSSLVLKSLPLPDLASCEALKKTVLSRDYPQTQRDPVCVKITIETMSNGVTKP